MVQFVNSASYFLTYSVNCAGTTSFVSAIRMKLEFKIIGLVGVGETLVEGGELALQVLGIGVQLLPQILSIGSQALLHQLCSVGQLALEVLSQGGHTFLELLQMQVHFLLQLLSVGAQLGLQLLHTLVQAGLQLLALLEQGGSQGVRVQGLGVRGQLLFQQLHSLLDLDLQVISEGFQFPTDAGQVLAQTFSQHLCLLGDLGHQVLGQRWELLLKSDGVLASDPRALCDAGTRKESEEFVR